MVKLVSRELAMFALRVRVPLSAPGEISIVAMRRVSNPIRLVRFWYLAPIYAVVLDHTIGLSPIANRFESGTALSVVGRV